MGLEIVLAYALGFAQPASLPADQRWSNSQIEYYCGDRETISRNGPKFFGMTPINTIVYLTTMGSDDKSDKEKYPQTFAIDFYKKALSLEEYTPTSLKEWVDKGDFDAFYIFEVNGLGQRKQSPTAGGYFRGGTLYVMTSHLNTKTGDISIPEPDGTVDNAYCVDTNRIPVSTVISILAKRIAKQRIIQQKIFK